MNVCPVPGLFSVCHLRESSGQLILVAPTSAEIANQILCFRLTWLPLSVGYTITRAARKQTTALVGRWRALRWWRRAEASEGASDGRQRACDGQTRASGGVRWSTEASDGQTRASEGVRWLAGACDRLTPTLPDSSPRLTPTRPGAVASGRVRWAYDGQTREPNRLTPSRPPVSPRPNPAKEQS